MQKRKQSQPHKGWKDAARKTKERALLKTALGEHDDHHGVFAKDFMPKHWTHKARKLLYEH